MSLDEARSGFLVDAPNLPGFLPPDGNYLLIGDNAYSYSHSGTNLDTGVIGDLDTYYLQVDPGSAYSIVISGDTPFGLGVAKPGAFSYFY